MSSGLIILIGFIISAVLILTVWLVSRNTRAKNRVQSDIKKQKADIISTIKAAVNDTTEAGKSRQRHFGFISQTGLPTWGKWFMVLALLPLIGSFIMGGMQGQGAKQITTQTTTSSVITTIPSTLATMTRSPDTVTAQSGDTVEVDYTLKLADGSVYQTTVGTGQPFSFELGTGQVIAGFDAAVTGMAVGQTKTVTIPAAQAYGTTPSASNPLAGPDLTFIITLDQIQPSLAREGFTVQVDYTLKLADGSVYQTTVGTGQHFSFTLGAGQVIAGFDAAVDGMKVGETKTVAIPAAQAYGTAPSASNPLAGQDLTFVIILLAINPAQ
jgi:peptidylprolyl isomerase